MFWASSCPSSGATITAVAASGLPSELGDSSAVVRGRAGRPDRPRPTVRVSASQSACWGHVRDKCVSSVLRAVRSLFAVVDEMQFEKMLGATGP